MYTRLFDRKHVATVCRLVFILTLIAVASLPQRPALAGPNSPQSLANGSIVINEVDADTVSTDTLEFIELYDGGTGSTDLTGLVIVLFNGSDDASYEAYDLDGYSTDANGYFVLGNSGVASVSLTFPDNSLQNGADAVGLYTGNAVDFPNDTPVTTANLIDALVYDTNDSDDAGLLALLNAAEPQVNEGGRDAKDYHSNQRCPNGTGGARNTGSYTQALPTPGTASSCGMPMATCGDAATYIHTIQGSGASSPLAGTSYVEIEGVVIGDFQTGLGGFFVQEEDTDADTDPLTSEGIFVPITGFDVDQGDVVRIQGDVVELYGQTALVGPSTAITVCTTGITATMTPVTLPVTSNTVLEQFEAMLVRMPQTLTVSENYNLGRYGELVLSSGGRLMNPTSVVTPSTPANVMQAANDLNRIVLDDGLSAQNPDPIIYPTPELSATNTLRSGDGVAGVVGALYYNFGEYKIEPTAVPDFIASNPRPTSPDDVGGSLCVATFNVLNYFNGDGLGGGFPTSRGADTSDEFIRQRDKLINAIIEMQADIIGLLEIENDGFGPNSAIQDLVNGLNAAAPMLTTYSFVDAGSGPGTDEIRVGLIYRTETITTTGVATTTLTTPFDLHRPPLAQTFTEIATGRRFTVAVNHFKSKGCTDATGLDEDQGDGQSCYNYTRTQMSQILADWLATDPTHSGDPDFLIIGDLNAYAMEDPITTLEAAAYTDLVQASEGPSAYSYVYFGQSGTIDYAMASPSVVGQVTGVTVWHVNADEPSVLDYNEEYKSMSQITSLYSDDQYRSSDHDPIIVGIELGEEFHYVFPIVFRNG